MISLLVLLALGCLSSAVGTPAPAPVSASPPTPIPSGVLISEIPPEMDLLFDSIRYVLNDTACLDEQFNAAPGFVALPGCNALIYDPQGDTLASPRQLFAMDIDTGEVVQITNLDCYFVIGQAIDARRMMALASCSDSDGNGTINESDKPEIYLLDLPSAALDCLTCGYALTNINNADFTPAAGKIVFSAQHVDDFHNYLFTIDLEKSLVQLTFEADFMDFDCAWSSDGEKIVFNRLPAPWLEVPSQVWLMDAGGGNLQKITDGGPNPDGEGPQGVYPIGIDADPDLSPDGRQVVFSRLKTGLENMPFGVYELVVVDVETGEMEVLDGQYANMVPQWKEGGILINRQIGMGAGEEIDGMALRQGLYLYRDGKFVELEGYPFHVFPVGAFGGYWIEGGG